MSVSTSPCTAHEEKDREGCPLCGGTGYLVMQTADKEHEEAQRAFDLVDELAAALPADRSLRERMGGGIRKAEDAVFARKHLDALRKLFPVDD